MTRLLVLDGDKADQIIRERQRLGLDHHDEVWEGMYVMPSMPNNDHQELVDNLGDVLSEVVKRGGLGRKLPGANVSDRRTGWKENYRVPDIVVVLKNSRAVDCVTHWFGGPDFLVEVESPGDDTEEKVPFYGQIGVRELLIVHRDKRTLRLLRHDGQELVLVKPVQEQGKEWLQSEVIPLAFRRTVVRKAPRTEVRRTDGQPGHWTV